MNFSIDYIEGSTPFVNLIQGKFVQFETTAGFIFDFKGKNKNYESLNIEGSLRVSKQNMM